MPIGNSSGGYDTTQTMFCLGGNACNEHFPLRLFYLLLIQVYTVKMIPRINPMSNQGYKHDETVAEDLILDELFDLTLYRKFEAFARGDTRRMLEELVIVEEKHLQFWKDYFHRSLDDLDFGRKVKMTILVSVGRLFGETGIHLVLEAIEIHGIRKYLDLWERSRGTNLESGIRTILTDEFGHEDAIVSAYSQKQINPERIRSVFLGFNDGLVEILGAVSGFFAAFGQAQAVLIAGLTVAVAGAVSMAAGAFAASNSENEVLSIERGKRKFLGAKEDDTPSDEHPLTTTLIVGSSYFVGAAFPILPIMFGASNPIPSIFFAGLAIILVSVILSFLSGMRTGKRIFINIMTIVFAVGISSVIGFLVRMFWGVTV